MWNKRDSKTIKDSFEREFRNEISEPSINFDGFDAPIKGDGDANKAEFKCNISVE